MNPALSDLGAALPLRPRGDGVFGLDVPTGWQQGRGAFGGQAGSVAAGWIRPRVETRRHDTLGLVAITDAWWPAALAAESGPRPMSTVAFHWSRYATPAGDDPLYHEGRVLASDEGFFTEERILWDAHGNLVVVNHQTFAVG